MLGYKHRKPPYNVHQVYGKVPAKLFHTLTCKMVYWWKQDSAGFAKTWWQSAMKKRHVHAPHPGKMHEP